MCDAAVKTFADLVDVGGGQFAVNGQHPDHFVTIPNVAAKISTVITVVFRLQRFSHLREPIQQAFHDGMHVGVCKRLVARPSTGLKLERGNKLITTRNKRCYRQKKGKQAENF